MPDLTRSDFNRHPVTVVLAHAAMGERPRAKDLDALELTAENRRRVEKAAADVADLKDDGQNQQARELAATEAEQIIAALPADQQNADYLEPAVTVPADPAGLAAQVRRN